MPDKTRSVGNLVSDNILFANPSTDNIGIGTTIPTSKLHVVGDVRISGFTTVASIGVSSSLIIPLGVPTSPSSRNFYSVGDTFRFRDSSNTERILLNNLDNFSNISNPGLARSNIGAASTAIFTSTSSGLVPASGIGSTTYLRSDGQFGIVPAGGSSGQLQCNINGFFAGITSSSIDASNNLTYSARWIVSSNGGASAPPVSLTGTWFTGGTSTTTKPQFLIEPVGTTSNSWSTAGTGLGVNAPSGFTGDLAWFGMNGESQFRFIPQNNELAFRTLGSFSGNSRISFRSIDFVATLYNRTVISINENGVPSWPFGVGEIGSAVLNATNDISYTRSRITFASSAGINGNVSLTAIENGCIQLSNRSGGAGILELKQATSGGVPSSDSARIYSKNVGTTAEVFVLDEAGNETQISPHNTNAPPSLVDSAFDEIGYTANYYTGLIYYTNKQRLLSGRADAQYVETFEEHNKRTGESMLVWDWDEVQANKVDEGSQEHPKPMPEWLVAQLSERDDFLAARAINSQVSP